MPPRFYGLYDIRGPRVRMFTKYCMHNMHTTTTTKLRIARQQRPFHKHPTAKFSFIFTENPCQGIVLSVTRRRAHNQYNPNVLPCIHTQIADTQTFPPKNITQTRQSQTPKAHETRPTLLLVNIGCDCGSCMQ